jgi:hypothetical protein
MGTCAAGRLVRGTVHSRKLLFYWSRREALMAVRSLSVLIAMTLLSSSAQAQTSQSSAGTLQLQSGSLPRGNAQSQLCVDDPAYCSTGSATSAGSSSSGASSSSSGTASAQVAARHRRPSQTRFAVMASPWDWLGATDRRLFAVLAAD